MNPLNTLATANLELDTTFLNSTRAGDFGITSASLESTRDRVMTALAAVEAKRAAKEYGFIEELNNASHLAQTHHVFEQITWAKTLVVVGIGGSDLGARAIQQALPVDAPPLRVIFHGDSTDPEQLRQLLRHLDLSSTVFNIISKSGQTVETISQYVFFKAKLQAELPSNGFGWQRHFVFTTDPSEGILRQEANAHGILTLPIPPSVGGRFSVLTPVGLLPALAMGVAVDALVQGALSFAQSDAARGLAQALATAHFQLYTQGTKLAIMMPYSTRLEEFCRWYRQLWAESVGKNGHGVLPIQARGPADQHSQLQFYAQGTPLASVLFVRLERPTQDFTLPGTDLDEVAYLAGHSFGEIVNAEQTATALSLFKQGRPSATLSITHLDATSLGELFMLFELGVVYLAEMLGVNAFDQPGVEESKQFMYALLGRAGFEDTKVEIEELRKKSATTV